MAKPQRLDGDRLEQAIEKIPDQNTRDSIYELLLRAREAVANLNSRVAALEGKLKRR